MSKDGSTTLPPMSDGEAERLIQLAGAEPCGMGMIPTPEEALLKVEEESSGDDD